MHEASWIYSKEKPNPETVTWLACRYKISHQWRWYKSWQLPGSTHFVHCELFARMLAEVCYSSKPSIFAVNFLVSVAIVSLFIALTEKVVYNPKWQNITCVFLKLLWTSVTNIRYLKTSNSGKQLKCCKRGQMFEIKRIIWRCKKKWEELNQLCSYRTATNVS